jgi:glycosyltransferase involved in cell wall biosynthesis
MRIAFLSTFYPFRGGIAQFNALMYRAFEKEHTVKAFTFKRQYPNFLFPGETQYVTNEDIADEIPSEEVLDSINPITYLSTAKKVKLFAPDIFITKYWMTFFGPSLGYVAKKLNKKAKRISVLDNVIPHEKRFFDGFCNRYFLKNNDGFIVMSDAVLRDLLSIKPDAKYIRVNHPVYNHFPAPIRQEIAKHTLKLDVNKKTLLFFGFIRDYKGLDLLIQAMDLLDDTYQLIIAGEVYGSFDKYQLLIDNSKAKNRIALYNQYIGDNEVADYFSAADVCILPYKSATQSGITSIANHYNLPIIATNVGGLKETIHHLKTGLIVENPSIIEIAESIRLYFDENYKSFFASEIEKEKQENSWENFAQKIVAFSKTI